MRDQGLHTMCISSELKREHASAQTCVKLKFRNRLKCHHSKIHISDYLVPANLIGNGEMRMDVFNPDQDLDEDMPPPVYVYVK